MSRCPIELTGMGIAVSLCDGFSAFEGVGLAQSNPILVTSFTTLMRALFKSLASVRQATALSCAVVSRLTPASDAAATVLVAKPVCTVSPKMNSQPPVPMRL
jgi:hypothetical protein